MLSLNEVYITEKTHQQVIAPGGKGRFHDPMTGETCWPAHCCNLPDCPGRSADGTPFLFVEVDKSIVDKPDGTTGFDAAAFKAGSKPSDGYCPKCWEANKLGSLPREQREKWLQNVKLYELPASLARRKELEAELKKWNAEIQIRVNRPLPASVKADQEEKK